MKPANDTSRRVTFTPESRDALRLVYAQHLDKMAEDDSVPDTFEFEGDTYLVGYVKYLLEYLDKQLGS
jgi:hypothetical protein